MSETIDPRITEFCAKLARLDAGDKARLKRNAGNTLAESRRVSGLFLNHLRPHDLPRYQEWAYFLVATLYPLNSDGSGQGSLGTALRTVRPADEKKAKSLDRRFEILLDSDKAHLHFRLRQMVKFLYSKRVSINWPLFLKHLLAWNSEKRWVQERWARDYFVGSKKKSEDTTS